MIRFKTEIPALCFPHELPEIEIESDRDEVELTVEGPDETATFQICRMEGLGLRVSGFDELVRDLGPGFDETDHPSYELTLTAEDDTDVVTTTVRVLTCNVNPGLPAEEYTRARFLTLCGSDKVTYPGAREWLYVYSADECEPYTVRCTYVSDADGCTVVREARTGLTPVASIVEENMYRMDVSPALWKKTAADGTALRLVAYEVICGRRVAHYSVRQSPSPCSLVFRNAFGCRDTLHLPQAPDAEVKPTRSSATFCGRMRNYRVVPTVELTGRTGPIGPGMTALVTDLCNTTWLTDAEGRDLVLLDQEVKPTGDSSSLTSCTIKWRYAKERPELLAEVQARTFDETFDGSFL